MPARSPERGSRPTLICLTPSGIVRCSTHPQKFSPESSCPMPFAGLLEAMMPGKFEWQFKYRDEADVNERAWHARGKFKKSLICRHFLRFDRFGLPWDFRTSITIARGGACPVVTICGSSRAVEGSRDRLALRAPAPGAVHCTLACFTDKATRQRSAACVVVRSTMSGKECRQYPGLRERGRRRTRQDQIPL